MSSGFLLIDKPYTWTSFDAVAVVRREMKTKKVGHCGTLDPLATGLLVVALGEATKLLEYLVGCDKTYEAEVTFGAHSSTDDAEGELEIELVSEPTKEEFLAATQQFLGEVWQIPPLFSAIKIGGEKACNLARKGAVLEMKPRKVQIDAIELLEWSWPKVRLRIDCGSGTYIRSLARDIGKALGGGAYLSALRRTRVGQFSVSDAVSPKEITPDRLLPLEIGASALVAVSIEDLQLKKLRNGIPVSSLQEFENGQIVAVFCDGELQSICKYDAENRLLRPVKNLVR